MKFMEQWNRMEAEVVDDSARHGWSRSGAKVFVRVWCVTISLFGVFCLYAAALTLLGYDDAARVAGNLAVTLTVGGIGSFIGVMLCEAEGRKR